MILDIASSGSKPSILASVISDTYSVSMFQKLAVMAHHVFFELDIRPTSPPRGVRWKQHCNVG